MNNSGIGTPYWYEWEIGLIECLKMLINPKVKSVILQSENFQSLDDVVIKYLDGSITNIQVKHTDIEGNLSYSFMTSDSLLETLAKEWKDSKEQYSINEIRLVTNRKWGPNKSEGKCSFDKFVTEVYPELQKNYDYVSSRKDKEYENNAIQWLKNKLSFLGDEASEFVKIFSFGAELNLEGLEEKIRTILYDIIGTTSKVAVDMCVRSLFSKLEIWATSKRKRQEILREDIYETLCITNKYVPTHELYPEKPVFPSRKRFAKKFIHKAINNEKKILFLEGMPGAGKTNFISYLSQLEDSIVDFRYYTYLPVSKEYPVYSDDEGYYSGDYLWHSLLHQMKVKFEELNLLSELKFPLIYGYLSTSEMRIQALKFLPIYAEKIGRTCYFFIDGLDHAARSEDSRKSFISQLPQPEELGDNVKFVLVGQPINDKYPNWLVNNDDIDYMVIPSLEQDDVITILDFEGIMIANVDKSVMANTIISIVGNNALNVMFAILEVKKMKDELTFDILTKHLNERKLNGQINRYYDWIINSIDQDMDLIKIESIFAYSSMKITLDQLSHICGCGIEKISWLLNKMYPLVLCNQDGYYIIHNDVRLYFRALVKSNSNYSMAIESISFNISKFEELTVFNYDILFDLINSIQDLQKLFQLMTPEYIMNSVRFNISIDTLLKQFSQIAKVNQNSFPLDHLDKLCNISTTLLQFVNCIQSNEVESSFIEGKMSVFLTQAEKYILNSDDSLDQIVSDIYQLLKNNQFDRAKKLYNEYLINKPLKIYLQDSLNEKKDFYNKSGYVSRVFNNLIFEQECESREQSYCLFVGGWLDASVHLSKPDEIRNTFNFKYYYRSDLLKYVETICKNDIVDEGTYKCLEEFLNKEKVPISTRIELCKAMILHGYESKSLVDSIIKNQRELIGDGSIEFDVDKIVYYFKMLFCIFQNHYEDSWDENYDNILKKTHNNEGKRGYEPAIEQKKLAKEIFSLFYGTEKSHANITDLTYTLCYFSQKYGTGSCHDCNSYKVLDFLREIFVSYFLNNKEQIVTMGICNVIFDVFTGDEEPRFFDVFLPLFYCVSNKDSLIKIAEFWCGKEGRIWNEDYATVNYYCNSIAPALKNFDEFEIADEIERRRRLKIFGYSGHKDYSLIDLEECFAAIPLSKNKLIEDGMLLLEISDSANSIGDNRVSTDIEESIFDIAVKLGPQYANALFELKNTPSDFMLWRDYLLTSYFKYLKVTHMDDEQLFALYKLTNAWINYKFELHNEYGKKDTLLSRNKVIYDLIESQKIKKMIMIEQVSKQEIYDNNYISEKEDHVDVITKLEKGYSNEFENYFNSYVFKRRGNVIELFKEIRNKLSKEDLQSFIKNCLLSYIFYEGEYGFRYTGIKNILEEYSSFFTQNDWLSIYNYIVEKIDIADIQDIYYVGGDIEILTLLYFKEKHPEDIQILFRDKCRIHKLFITACGLLNDKKYELNIDNSVKLLSDLVCMQIG